MLDAFLSENPARLSPEELRVVEGWKNHRKGEFYLVEHRRAHSLFYDPKAGRVFGVVALKDPFEELVPLDPPVLLRALLLPFDGRITYDGILNYFPIHFGGGMRGSFRAEAGNAVRKWGVITSLDGEPEERKLSDEENLAFYLKSAANRERYWKEIERLRNRSPELKALFHRERGKHHARGLKAKLEAAGARGVFAVVDDVVVAGAPDENGLEKALHAIVPEERQEWVYQFTVGERKKMSRNLQSKKTEIKKRFEGKWNIVEMSNWDEDYFNMEVRAYIRIEKGGTGEFQFGLVSGALSGDFENTQNGAIFDFTWDGRDECDLANGDGWMETQDGKTAEGEFRIHQGDRSRFVAKKAKR